MLGTHSSFYSFDDIALSVVAGGSSILDHRNLNIHSLDEAESFIRSYGFQLSNPQDLESLWYFHRRALVLIREKLNVDTANMPEELRSKESLGDIRKLLIYASQSQNKALRRWSCAILRCMHVFVHAETDLFSSFSEEIQKQILTPFQNAVRHEDTKLQLVSFQKEGHPHVELYDFQTKPFKTSSSTVIKLLAKQDALAIRVFDKLGVRFVTKTVFDSFQVIRFLVEENLISFPLIMPEQSSNNMYPVEEFLAVCDKLSKKHSLDHRWSSEQVDRLLANKIKNQNAFLGLFRKENPYSSADFKYIKFISRQLIRIDSGAGKPFSFFYPFEVQIMNQDAYGKIQSGESEHSAYKNRQVQAAVKRLFPE